MYRFINFNDEKVDSMLVMELTDLAKTLAKDASFDTEFRVHSYVDRSSKIIYVSHFWNHRPFDLMVAGLKTDVYLRAFGNLHYSDFHEVNVFNKWVETQKNYRFAQQMFKLLEDLRVEAICIKLRPGMAKDFAKRRQVYMEYFKTQYRVNTEKSIFTDALFNLAYLILNADRPFLSTDELNEHSQRLVPMYQERLFSLYDAKSTSDIAKMTKSIVDLFEAFEMNDLLTDYFHLSQVVEPEYTGETYNDLLRKDELRNDDQAKDPADGDEEVFDEEMKTWHHESEEKGKSFLQFELDQGTGTDIEADTAREGEASDQALGLAQGSSKKTSQKDYSEFETIEYVKDDKKDGGNLAYGRENIHATTVFLPRERATLEMIQEYELMKKEISAYQKKLKRMIELTLEQKKIAPRTDLLYGRLNNKLLRFFTDEKPRLFYKKDDDSHEIDAVFSLLVDCSASMYDKMEETKRGIVLFHEALKSLKVQHEIVGFWEDANEASSERQPNYFHEVVDFSASTQQSSGAEIMQLEPQEDNRDGYSIRVISERLVKRLETQKFLLVFSDGEPAAYGYDQNGIIDTHEAVQLARKQGVEVFNIFLSQSGIDEEQMKVFQNIYGHYSITVPSIDQLPDILFPLLKKLLHQAIA